MVSGSAPLGIVRGAALMVILGAFAASDGAIFPPQRSGAA
jgi:hypothetical protein